MAADVEFFHYMAISKLTDLCFAGLTGHCSISAKQQSGDGPEEGPILPGQGPGSASEHHARA